MKHKYRTKIILRKLEHVERKVTSQFKVDILQAINDINSAYNDVKDSTIQNCFKKSGLIDIEEVIETEEESLITDECRELMENSDDMEYSLDEYLNFDDQIQTNAIVSDENLIEQYAELSETEISDTDDEQQDSMVSAPPTVENAMNSISTIRTFFQSKSNISSETFKYLDKVESAVIESKLRSKKQPEITSYFEHMQ